ncbi:hypothetical protein DXX93_14575 [Thalassotalea euphylliae]|uniref:DUF2007 domain-containing protein n=1 Tax=Thalassotalea euphylliae TaxID=1655234 RepID=A0A3E0TT57_9GAMM|nr:hypothetical protein [Thalassotalea euphylliae]REL27659.1 hypothetical protein DXX93_14575 [Thalassotalea euphylliae]
MNNSFFKWDHLPTTFMLVIIFSVSSCSKKDEFCTVIDDLRKVDTVKVVNTFDDSKIAYFVDLQNSYQILVKKSQVEEAYKVLGTLGIKNRSKLKSTCKVVH